MSDHHQSCREDPAATRPKSSFMPRALWGTWVLVIGNYMSPPDLRKEKRRRKTSGSRTITRQPQNTRDYSLAASECKRGRNFTQYTLGYPHRACNTLAVSERIQILHQILTEKVLEAIAQNTNAYAVHCKHVGPGAVGPRAIHGAGLVSSSTWMSVVLEMLLAT